MKIKTAGGIVDNATEFGTKVLTRYDLIWMMKRYALIVAGNTRKRCANRATIKHIGTFAVVDKESILDVEIITP